MMKCVSFNNRQIILNEDKKFILFILPERIRDSEDLIGIRASDIGPTNKEIIAYMAIAYPVMFAEWLRERDCNCFECSEANGPGSQTPCNEKCEENMIKFLNMNYDYNIDIFGINDKALEDMK